MKYRGRGTGLEILIPGFVCSDKLSNAAEVLQTKKQIDRINMEELLIKNDVPVTNNGVPVTKKQVLIYKNHIPLTHKHVLVTNKQVLLTKKYQPL